MLKSQHHKQTYFRKKSKFLDWTVKMVKMYEKFDENSTNLELMKVDGIK